MALTDEEKAQLKQLQEKEKEPPAGRSERINFTVDLSDETSVRRGIKLGLVSPDALDDLDGGDDDDKDDDDKPAKDRRTTGRQKKDPAADGQPRRRLRGADRWAAP